jgi:hypothetical protein
MTYQRDARDPRVVHLVHDLNARESSAKGFVDDLNGAVRENPIAAGLVGLGVAWMLFGNRRVSRMGRVIPRSARRAAGSIGSAGMAGSGAVASGVTAAASSIADAAGYVGDNISSGVQKMGSAMRNTFAPRDDYYAPDGQYPEESRQAAWRDGLDAVRDTSGDVAQRGLDFGKSMQRNLSDTLERQPLLLGAIGLAIGAGVASAFPSTRMEGEWMGAAGDAAREKAQEFASDATDAAKARASQVFDDIKQEAAAQGLTASAGKDALAGVTDKLGNIASSTRDAVKERIS